MSLFDSDGVSAADVSHTRDLLKSQTSGGQRKKAAANTLAKPERPSSSPALLRGDGLAPVRPSDSLRQRIEDTSVRREIGRYKRERIAQREVVSGVDFLSDQSLYDLKVLHNGTQRARSAAAAERSKDLAATVFGAVQTSMRGHHEDTQARAEKETEVAMAGLGLIVQATTSLQSENRRGVRSSLAIPLADRLKSVRLKKGNGSTFSNSRENSQNNTPRLDPSSKADKLEVSKPTSPESVNIRNDAVIPQTAAHHGKGSISQLISPTAAATPTKKAKAPPPTSAAVRELRGVSDKLRSHTKARCRAAGIPTKCVEDPNLAEITLRMTKAHLRIQSSQVPHKRSPLEDAVPDSQVLQKLGAFLRGVGGMSALLDSMDNGHGCIKKHIWVASLELLGFPGDAVHAFKLLDKRSRGELARTHVVETFKKEGLME